MNDLVIIIENMIQSLTIYLVPVSFVFLLLAISQSFKAKTKELRSRYQFYLLFVFFGLNNFLLLHLLFDDGSLNHYFAFLFLVSMVIYILASSAQKGNPAPNKPHSTDEFQG